MNVMSLKRQELYIDIGSANTRIYLGNKEIFCEPTCIAYHRSTNSVVAVGKKALMLLGKTPTSIDIGFPIQHGSVANTKYFELFISSVLSEFMSDDKLSRLVFGLSGKVAVMSSLSPAKKRLLRGLLKNVGFSKIDLIDAAYVSALSISGGGKAQTGGVCVVDIGAQKTEIAVFSMNDLVASRNFKWGGIKLTEVLQKVARSQHQCVVGWHLAEEAKKQVGTLDESRKKFALRGKDLMSQVSKTVVFSSDDVRVEFNKLFDDLFYNIQNFISTLPSETAISVLDRGILLTGGGSMLGGIDDVIRKRLKCDVYLSSNPEKNVINGLII